MVDRGGKWSIVALLGETNVTNELFGRGVKDVFRNPITPSRRQRTHGFTR